MSESLRPPLLVFGATTASGAALLELAASRRVLVAGRRSPPQWPRERFLAWDLEAPSPPSPLPEPQGPAPVLVSFAPIWCLAPFLERWLAPPAAPPGAFPAATPGNPAGAPIAGVVACSSSSALTKRFAANRFDQQLVERLTGAEARVAACARAAAIPCQILRPTLIYGQAGSYGDRNLSSLVQWMARLPLLPLPAQSGLRQPIHARQLAEVALHLADHPGAAPSPLAIGGDEVLRYGAMLERLRQSVARNDPKHPAGRCRLQPVPNRLFHLLAAPLLPLSAKAFEAVLRIQADLGPFPAAHQVLAREPEAFPVGPLALGQRGSAASPPSPRSSR